MASKGLPPSLANALQAVRRHTGAIIFFGLIGLWTGGFIGLLFGGAIGFWLANKIRRTVIKYNPQELFFRVTFTVMGKLAKADGRVTENEIEFARQVMNQMRLSEPRRQAAMALFSEGKSDGFDIESVLKPMATIFRHQPPLKLAFIEIQLQIALADGEVSDAEQQIISQICSYLGLTQYEIDALVARVQAQQSFHQHGGWQPGADPAAMLNEAYGVLGVTEQASDAEVKKAYRRLMNQHHPDKLVAKGLPEDMMEMAKEKSQEIQAAYDQIKRARKG